MRRHSSNFFGLLAYGVLIFQPAFLLPSPEVHDCIVSGKDEYVYSLKTTQFQTVFCSVHHNLRGHLRKQSCKRMEINNTYFLKKTYSKCCIKHSNGTELSSFFTRAHFWSSKTEDILAIIFWPQQQLMTRQSTNSTANKN